MSWLGEAVEKMRTMAMGSGEYGEGYEEGDVYEDEYDEDETRREDETRKLKPIKNPREREAERAAAERGARREETRKTTRERADNVITMPGAESANEIIVFKPESVDDCDAICWHVRGACAVALNLEDVKNADGQRIIDFVSGVVSALDGDLRECARRVYLITPRNFTITGQHEEVLRKAGIIMPSKR